MCASKDTINKNNQPTKWEKTLSITDHRLISSMYIYIFWKLLQIKKKKIRLRWKKLENHLDISLKKAYGEQAHENMLNIISHWGNASKTIYNEISLHIY